MACLAGAALAGVYASRHLGMDTDTAKMISADVPWRQASIDYDRAFPQDADLAIVVDAPTEEAARDGAGALAQRLEAEPSFFAVVRRPADSDFWRREGLLFLPLDELRGLADRLADMQPMIGKLAQDPSLRGLFSTLNLVLDAILQGAADLKALEPALAPLAGATEAAVAGRHEPLSWQALFSGGGGAQPGRQIILAQPVCDYGALEPCARPRAAVRAAAHDLGLIPESGFRVRQSGSAALDDEQFATVAEGAGLATLGSFLGVTLLLFVALRSWRLIFAIQTTLLAGLALTAGFAALAVGTLNMISVAFAVLFVGIGVDFGIQVAVRYREERHRLNDLGAALSAAGAGIGAALALATLILLAGFLSFLPTDYKGVSELGIIAGAGMTIAFALNLTMLPALLTVLRPPAEAAAVGYAWAAPIDRFLVRRRRPVAAAALAVALVGAALLPLLRFDFNPLNLMDPKTESMATLLDLMGDPLISPHSLDVLVPDAPAAQAVAARLEALAEVKQVLTLASFVPEDQEEKLLVIADLAAILEPSLLPGADMAPAASGEILAALSDCAERLERATAGEGIDHPARRLARALAAAAAQGPAILEPLRQALLTGLPERLADLAQALQAEPVDADTLPDDIRGDWIATDGRLRVAAYPAGDGRSNEVLRRFVEAVRAVAPNATGTPVTILESGRTVVGAFVTAGSLALLAIALILRLVLGSWLDVALVLAPLGLAALLGVITAVAADFPITFANIIALPLLLGIGVAFDLYFVVNWRRGATGPLQSSTARAVFFSAATTVTAVTSLALSSHPGTADMGLLLAVSLAYALASTLLVLPALLAFRAPPRR